MTFRIRVLALVVVVAFGATVATAWLTLRQAGSQVEANQRDSELIQRELLGFVRQNGTWFAIGDRVLQLSWLTGQRIHLVDDNGQAIADSDELGGGTARPVGATAISLNPAPTLILDSELDPKRAVVSDITLYRRGILLGRCLFVLGFPVEVTPGPDAVPLYRPEPAAGPVPGDTLRSCHNDVHEEEQREKTTDIQAVGTCEMDRVDTQRCLQNVFADRTRFGQVAPRPVTLYLGVAGENTAPLQIGPALLLAFGVGLVAIAGSLLVSRRLLRPVRQLMRAARHVGAGDLAARVPAVGRDELADLGRSFNRMADSLQEAEERQRRMVADVAHELRTPLANLRGYLEALQDGVLPPDPELFALLHRESLFQQRIVDDLQELALADAGALAYHRVPTDLAELVVLVAASHGCTADVAEEVEVVADPDRLRQVLVNLVSNAVRATPADGAITLRLIRWPEKHRAVIEVIDTGTGIEEAALPHVFERFWRADPARGVSSGGAGLGLAIVRRIVQDHGGAISVESVVGVGTTFTIELPLAPVAP